MAGSFFKLAREREELRVVNDKIGAPTWSRAIAEITSQISAQGMGNLSEFSDRHTGLYHLSASGETSWYDFTQAMIATIILCALLKSCFIRNDCGKKAGHNTSS
ncbi:NAD(P)-dependent oxidoreductase [Anabaenopsis sp. FSS-46]|nr:sugar nucleotide-binding protein [Anabaenopsis sp. FSS-46]MDH6100747.1 NAD(P)-dependent oxidoreductase [Anabaenopsis sp. FSS-46]